MPGNILKRHFFCWFFSDYSDHYIVNKANEDSPVLGTVIDVPQQMHVG